MKRNFARFITVTLLTLISVFVLPASTLLSEDFSLVPEVSALLSANDPELTREKVEQEMYERYKEIFDFVSQPDISIEAQAVPFTSGRQQSSSEIDALSAELTAGCSTDYEKAVALYEWVTDNLYYDYDYYNGITKSTNLTATDVFANKNTVCEGFANLYTAMCRSVGVPCRKIDGYSASSLVSDEEYYASYFENIADHAWNEIYVNGEWIVVDATWDCGNTFSGGVFTKKSRTTKWFGMAFEEFSKRHMGMNYCCSFESDEFTFTVDENIITASNYTGENKRVVIPEGVHVISDISKTKNDFTSIVLSSTVTSISSNAFKNCTSLVGFVVPEGVTEIGDYAFSDCTALKTVILPSSLTEIGSSAFRGCTALTQITLPEGMKTVSSSAFNGCSSLVSVSFPSTLEKIEDSAFRDCISLKAVTLPESITSLGYSAFYGCTGLESAQINCGIKNIPSKCFFGCTALTSVHISSTVTEIGNEAFIGCTALKTITGGENVKILRYQAFRNCTVLEDCDFFNQLTRLEYWAFRECEKITSITIPYTYPNIDEWGFYNCKSLEKVVILGNVTMIDECVFYKCESLKEVIIPSTVTSIGEYAFADCVSLEAIDLPDGLKAIPKSLFSGCVKLKSIGGDIPSSVTSIGEYAFYNCILEGKYTIPDGITTIPRSAFYQCNGITELTIPTSVTSIDEFAFTRTTSLTDVYYRGSQEQWENVTVGANNSAFLAAELHFLNEHEHSYSSEITLEPTCTIAGVMTYTCSCNDSYTQAIPSLGHTEVAIPEVKATCTSTGLTAGVKCSVCGEVITAQTVTEKIPHTESGWITDTSATCSKAGAKHTECTACGTVLKTDTISKLAHTEIAIPEVKANCTSTGLTAGVKCSVCGEIITAQNVTEKLPHTESAWITDTSATCSKEGAKHTECTVCGTELKTDTISKLAHTEVAIPEVKATCTSTGLTAGVKCSVCGEVITAQTVTEKLPHTESAWITDTSATCSKEGAKHTECTVCGTELKTDTISKLAHTEVAIPEVKATCTSTGLTAGVKCSVCGEVITAQTATEKMPHTESTWITDTSATCSKEGEKHTECTVCGTELKTETIDKLAHTEVAIPEVKATCTSTGLTAGVKCSVCGEVITAQTVTERIPHTESSWITDYNPTCTKDGKKHTICLVCDKTLQTSGIAKLAHKDGDNDKKCDMCSVSMNPADNCSHMCHKGGFSGFIWSIIRFFSKLFGTNKVCECGELHY